jgi:hypothetical protein
VHTDDCGWTNPDASVGGFFPGTPILLGGVRYQYDTLPEGEFTRGRLTSRTVENYDVTDGSFLGEHVAEMLAYDDLGRISAATSTRTIGTVATRTVSVEYDEFGVTTRRITESASDVTAGPFVRKQSASTWPTLDVEATGINGETTITRRDRFGRTTQVLLESDGPAHTQVAIRYVDDPNGREIVETTFPEKENRPQTTHVHLDALGRARFRQIELGADYAGATLVTDLVVFDRHGRVAFAAAPFEWAELPFSPDSLPDDPFAWPFGVSLAYDRAGRVQRSVEAAGPRPDSTYSSVDGDVFVTSFAYRWGDGRAITRSSTPRENDPAEAAFGGYRERVETAIGWPIEDATYAAGDVRLDLVRRSFDRLSNATLVRRFRDALGATNEVDWVSRFDSGGRLLSLQEPETAVVNNSYDDWGATLETSWMQGAKRRVQRHRYACSLS